MEKLKSCCFKLFLGHPCVDWRARNADMVNKGVHLLIKKESNSPNSSPKCSEPPTLSNDRARCVKSCYNAGGKRLHDCDRKLVDAWSICSHLDTELRDGARRSERKPIPGYRFSIRSGVIHRPAPARCFSASDHFWLPDLTDRSGFKFTVRGARESPNFRRACKGPQPIGKRHELETEKRQTAFRRGPDVHIASRITVAGDLFSILPLPG
eukprot:663629-Prorocentrum_minimum.AAC.5